MSLFSNVWNSSLRVSLRHCCKISTSHVKNRSWLKELGRQARGPRWWEQKGHSNQQSSRVEVGSLWAYAHGEGSACRTALWGKLWSLYWGTGTPGCSSETPLYCMQHGEQTGGARSLCATIGLRPDWDNGDIVRRFRGLEGCSGDTQAI